MAGGSKKSANDILAVELATGQTIEQAALTANCSTRTVFRRLEDPAFAERLKALRKDMVTRASGVLCDSMAEAATVLRGLLKYDGKDVRVPVARVRLGAAKAVIELGVKVAEVADLEERLAALERQHAQDQHGGNGQ